MSCRTSGLRREAQNTTNACQGAATTPPRIGAHVMRLSRDFQGAQAAKGKVGPPIRGLVDLAQMREALDQRRDCQVSLKPGECAAQTHVGVPAERYVAISLAVDVETIGVFKL